MNKSLRLFFVSTLFLGLSSCSFFSKPVDEDANKIKEIYIYNPMPKLGCTVEQLNWSGQAFVNNEECIAYSTDFFKMSDNVEQAFTTFEPDFVYRSRITIYSLNRDFSKNINVTFYEDIGESTFRINVEHKTLVVTIDYTPVSGAVDYILVNGVGEPQPYTFVYTKIGYLDYRCSDRVKVVSWTWLIGGIGGTPTTEGQFAVGQAHALQYTFGCINGCYWANIDSIVVDIQFIGNSENAPTKSIEPSGDYLIVTLLFGVLESNY